MQKLYESQDIGYFEERWSHRLSYSTDTSGLLQPLDVAVFGLFVVYLREFIAEVEEATSVENLINLNIFIS